MVCEVSVVIPYYDKWPRFKYLLESLRVQDYPAEQVEVIVVDDGSRVPLIELLGQERLVESGQLKVYRLSNGGRSAARNAGARLADGHMLIFVDDDIILPPDFISRHVLSHRLNSGDCFVHGRMYDLPELMLMLDPETGEPFPFLPTLRSQRPALETHLLTFERVFGHWDNFSISRGRISRLERLIARTLNTPELRRCHWIGCVGGNFSVSKDVFMEAGAFDEKFRVWGGEDFEFGYRLNRMGIDALYERDMQSYHLTHAHAQAVHEFTQSKLYFISKHKDANIGLLYDFLEKKIDERQLIELWRKATNNGNDQSEVGIEGW